LQLKEIQEQQQSTQGHWDLTSAHKNM